AAGPVLTRWRVLGTQLALAVRPVGEVEALGTVRHGLALPRRLGAGLAGAERGIGGAAGQANCRGLGQLAVEIDARFIGEALAELLAQHAGTDHLDAADRQVAELERAEAHADQAVDREAERPEDVLDLAVLAFAQRQDKPDIAALLTLQRRFDRAIFHAIDLETILERIELRLGDAAKGADAIFAQPAGGRQLEHTLEAAIVGEQQQAFGVDVEASDGDDTRQALLFERLEDGGAAFRVLLGDHEAGGLVVEPDAGALAGLQRLAIDLHLVLFGDVESGGADHLAVDGDAAVLDPELGVTARAEAGAGDDFGKPVAGKGRSDIGHLGLLRDLRAKA